MDVWAHRADIRQSTLGRRVSGALLVAIAISTTVYASRSTHDGIDFTNNISGPVRGLLSGRNPYDPANAAYLRRYGLSLVGGLYTPTVLLMHLPLAALSKSRAADIMAVLDAVLVWAGVLLLVRPRSPLSCLIAAVAGTLLVFYATVQDSVAFGQIAPWAFLGLALLVSTIGAPVSPWWPAAGVVLISLKPQSLLPIFVLLALLGAWQVIMRAAALIVVTSLPAVVLFLRAAGGLSAASSTIQDNLRFFAHVPEDDLHNSLNNRIDALGVLSHLHGPVFAGLGWDVLAFAIATVLVELVLVATLGKRPRASLDEPFVIALATVLIVVSLYHQPYDQLVLFVAPLAVVGAVLAGRPLTRSDDVLLAGGAALLAVELLFRSGFRARMVTRGYSEHAVRATYFSAPTLLAIATVAVAAVVYSGTTARRTSTDPIP